MARRKQRSHDEELPFVALMDTMTNVVGVLIIVLVMIGISLANSVRKILSDLPPVTVEQLQEVLKKVVDATPKEDPKKLAEEKKKLEDQIKKAAEELKTLDLSSQKQNVKLMDLDEAQKKVDDGKKQRDAEKAKTDQLLAEVDKLKALLDSTPVYHPPPATVVKLPNPRAMPEKAVIQRFLVAGGRVLYLNDEEFMKLVVGEIEKNEKSLINSEVPIKGADGVVLMVKDRFGKMVPRTKTVLDQKKLAAHFEKLRIGTRELKLELVVTPTSARIPMRLTPLPGAGETTEQIKNPAAVFQRAMRKFKSEPDNVVWFLVYKDSVETYLAARDIADQVGVPVGWEIYPYTYYQRPVTAYEVDYTPPKPPTTPPAVPAVRIAPPKNTLD
jgi:hypothetical protein